MERDWMILMFQIGRLRRQQCACSFMTEMNVNVLGWAGPRDERSVQNMID